MSTKEIDKTISILRTLRDSEKYHHTDLQKFIGNLVTQLREDVKESHDLIIEKLESIEKRLDAVETKKEPIRPIVPSAPPIQPPTKKPLPPPRKIEPNDDIIHLQKNEGLGGLRSEMLKELNKLKTLMNGRT